jgi:hypothetical protein
VELMGDKMGFNALLSGASIKVPPANEHIYEQGVYLELTLQVTRPVS